LTRCVWGSPCAEFYSPSKVQKFAAILFCNSTQPYFVRFETQVNKVQQITWKITELAYVDHGRIGEPTAVSVQKHRVRSE
jgi:hypothetical protein